MSADSVVREITFLSLLCALLSPSVSCKTHHLLFSRLFRHSNSSHSTALSTCSQRCLGLNGTISLSSCWCWIWRSLSAGIALTWPRSRWDVEPTNAGELPSYSAIPISRISVVIYLLPLSPTCSHLSVTSAPFQKTRYSIVSSPCTIPSTHYNPSEATMIIWDESTEKKLLLCLIDHSVKQNWHAVVDAMGQEYTVESVRSVSHTVLRVDAWRVHSFRLHLFSC